MVDLLDIEAPGADAPELSNAFAALTYGSFSAYLFGAKGDGITDDYAALQDLFDAALAANATATIPSGTYMTSQELVAFCPISMQGAVIKASAAMQSVLTIGKQDATSYRVNQKRFYGLCVDADRKAEFGIWFKYTADCSVIGVECRNLKTKGIVLGNDDGVGATSYGLFLYDLHVNSPNYTANIVADSVGVYQSQYCTDVKIISGDIVDAEFSFQTNASDCHYAFIHSWNHNSTGQFPTSCYVDNGYRNFWIGCQADTPADYGWNVAQTHTMFQACKVYLNGNGADNHVIGVHFAQSQPFMGMEGCLFQGVDTSHRLAKDHDLNSFTGSQVHASRLLNVVTPSTAVFSAADSAGRQLQFLGTALTFNYTGETQINFQNGTGRIDTGSSPRVRFGSYGAALALQASATPPNNLDLIFEAVSNTEVRMKLKGSDGTVRSVTLTLA